MKTIYQRLDEIIPQITKPSFRQNRGLGNEIGYWIFDYDPEHEMLVREHVQFIKQKINHEGSTVHIREFDLYDMMVEILEEKGYLEKAFKMEEVKGSEAVYHANKKTLRVATDRDLIIQYMTQRVQPNDIVFITGVGKAYPIIRSHTILNNLHKAIEDVPVVMFFPGSYDGVELVLFNEIKDDNYYRAFPLVDKYL
jgi:hypothetical protein